MNELSTRQNNAAMPVTFNFFDPEQFATMQRVAKMFAYSELVPDIYKVNVPQGADEKTTAIAEMKAMSNCVIALDGHAEPCHHLWSPVMVCKVPYRNGEHMRTF